VNKMENKTLISIFVIFLVASVLFFGATITGLVVQKVEYNDLCREDSNCQSGNCCIIYEDKNLGLCMENCQSFNFLCKSDEDCQIGTVCCVPSGKDYGICNYKEKCMDVDVFAEYIGRTTFADPSWIREQKALVEKPAKIDSNNLILIETAVIAGLIVFIIWILMRGKRKEE